MQLPYFAPVITSENASSLLSEIADAFHSDAWLIVAAALIIPAAVFVSSGRHLRKYNQALFLLALVLILSLSVTGINVAFGYISNYFTNALVKINQDMAYLFVAVYFCGCLVGIPVGPFTVTGKIIWVCDGGDG